MSKIGVTTLFTFVELCQNQVRIQILQQTVQFIYSLKVTNLFDRLVNLIPLET